MNSTLTEPALHRQFDACVRVAHQKAILRAVFEGYRSTWESCNALEDEVQHQAWGFARWNGVDSALLGVGKRYAADGVAAGYVRNTEQTEVKHAELRIGPFIITAHTVQSRTSMPQHCSYRAELAKSNEEMLFAIGPVTEGLIWAPILHIPDAKLKVPSRVFVAFPNGPDSFASQHIDLLSRYPGTVAGEQEVEIKMPKIRVVHEHGS